MNINEKEHQKWLDGLKTSPAIQIMIGVQKVDSSKYDKQLYCRSLQPNFSDS